MKAKVAQGRTTNSDHKTSLQNMNNVKPSVHPVENLGGMAYSIGGCQCKKPIPYRTGFGIQALGCRRCGYFIINERSDTS